MLIVPLRGVIKTSPVITILANATAQTLWIRTTNTLTGSNAARTVILRKLMAYNSVGASWLAIGTGLAGGFAAAWPYFTLVAGDNEWTEQEIPGVEIGANLTIQTDLLGVTVVIEVEEIG